MKKFNMSEWVLHHRQFTYFFIFLLTIAGCFSYYNLGRMEDPDYTIKEMIIVTQWPGATAKQAEEQVTDKIEKKLQDLSGLKDLQSYSLPGQSIIYVELKDTIDKKDIPSKWLEVRNFVGDIQGSLPAGTSPPQFNDHFDDVYGTIYALTGDGYTYEQLRQQAEQIRQTLLGVPHAKKVELIGVQTESIYLEMQNEKLAQLGITPTDINTAIQAENSTLPAGMLETNDANLYLRVDGLFHNLEDINKLPIKGSSQNMIRLGDIAKVRRDYIEPSDPKFFYQGKPAIGIAVSMEPGANIIEFGKDVHNSITSIQKQLSAGLELQQTVNQAETVNNSIHEFIESLIEAVFIIFLVSFVSLGIRSGTVVALCIPFVLAVVFTIMYITHIDLQRISLGALIIALGLLVDDAMIVTEMMIVKLEEGWSRAEAATAAYTLTAKPMLTGTLITCAGFIPVGLAKGSASEFCASIFYVISIALITSWIVAGSVTPLTGYNLIAAPKKIAKANLHTHKIYKIFIKTLTWCLNYRKRVLCITGVLFIMALLILAYIPEEFFPASTRPELIVRLELPAGASLKDTEATAADFAKHLENNNNISYFTYHTGESAPRFVLTFDPALSKPNLAEFVIVAKNVETRQQLQDELPSLITAKFPNVKAHTKVIVTGSSADYPVMLRVVGNDEKKVQEIAQQVATKMRAEKPLRNINLNWSEKNTSIKLSIDRDKATALGLTTSSLSNALQAALSGTTLSEYQEKDRTVPIIFKLNATSTDSVNKIASIAVPLSDGKTIPLEQIARISLSNENGIIYRRNNRPAVLISAETVGDANGDDLTRKTYDSLQDLRHSLPPGYAIEYDGATEESITDSALFLEPVPLMIIATLVLLMMQLQSIPKMLITLLTAPMGIIGVSFGLLLTGKPWGFVVQMGVLALFGIIIRNSVILMDQIDIFQREGQPLREAIINAAVNRLRPILLTAAAAILAMLPLMNNIFWGPMAVAMGAGLFCATILTLLILPVMYACLYKAVPKKQ